MNEPLIDIAAVPGDPRGLRWRALAPGGAVAGVAGLRPIMSLSPAPALSPSIRPSISPSLSRDLLPRSDPTVRELSLVVEPEWRRRGIGSRLLSAVREHAAGSRLVADVVAASPGSVGSPAAAFCLRHGFRHTRSRRHDLLTYADVHHAWLGELVDTRPAGYRLTYWTGDLSTVLRGPSHPGNTVATAADADGDLAAWAVAVVGQVSQRRARQYGPSVLPGHRGRRLDVWVNAALIQRLREVHPHIDEIETVTAEDDPHLLAVRGRLGFRPFRRTHLYELAPVAESDSLASVVETHSEEHRS
jgi:GNAT superfamily N-acetyltransferase